MNILGVYAEDIDFPQGSTPPTLNTAGGYHRSGYVRGSFDLYSYAGTCRSKAFSGGAVTSCWFSFRIYINGIGENDETLVGLIKYSTEVKGLYFGRDHGLNAVLYKYDGSTKTLLATATDDAFASAQINKVDVQITNFGASANVKIYLNGSATPSINYTGDVTVTGVTDLDAVTIPAHGASFNHYLYLSEMIVADADTRALGLVALAPNAAGDANQWDGDGYGGIDETTISDADLVYTDTADEDFQCNLTATPAGQFGVIGIVIKARACKSNDASIQGLKLGVKSEGTIDLDAARDMTTAWDTYERIAHTINGAQLTTSLLDALQLDLRTSGAAGSSASASVSASVSSSASASASAS